MQKLDIAINIRKALIKKMSSQLQSYMNHPDQSYSHSSINFLSDKNETSMKPGNKFIVEYSSNEEEDTSIEGANTIMNSKDAEPSDDQTATIGYLNNEGVSLLRSPILKTQQATFKTNFTNISEKQLKRNYSLSTVSTELTSDQDYVSAFSEIPSTVAGETESYYFNSDPLLQVQSIPEDKSPKNNNLSNNKEESEEEELKGENTKISEGSYFSTKPSGFSQNSTPTSEQPPLLSKRSSISTLIKRRSSIPMLKDFYYDESVDTQQRDEELQQHMRGKSNSEMIYRLLVNDSTSTTDFRKVESRSDACHETSNEERNLTKVSSQGKENSSSNYDNTESIVLPHRSSSGSLRRRASRISQSIKRHNSVYSSLRNDSVGEELKKSELLTKQFSRNITPVKSTGSSLKRSNATRRKIGWMSQLLSLLSEIKLKINQKWRNLKSKRAFRLKRSRSGRKKTKKNLLISEPQLIGTSYQNDKTRNLLANDTSQLQLGGEELAKLPKIIEEDCSEAESFTKSLNTKSNEYKSSDIKYQNMNSYLETENNKMLDRIEEKRKFSNTKLVNKHVPQPSFTQETIFDKENRESTKEVNKELLGLWSHYLKTLVKNRIQMRIEIDEITVPAKTRYSYLVEGVNAGMKLDKETDNSTTGGGPESAMERLNQNSALNSNMAITKERLMTFEPPHKYSDDRRKSILHSIISESESFTGSTTGSSFYSDHGSLSDQTSVSLFDEQQSNSNFEKHQFGSFRKAADDIFESNEVFATKNLHLKYAQEALLEKRESIFSVDSNDNSFPIVVGANNEDSTILTNDTEDEQTMNYGDNSQFLNETISLISASDAESESEAAFTNVIMMSAADRSKKTARNWRQGRSDLGKRNSKLIKQLEKFMNERSRFRAVET